MLKITRQLGCVFQDMGPPKSSSILRKSSNILKPIRCVRFTEAMVRYASIRNQKPSLGMICPGDLHHRNSNPPKFEDRSQEETEWQERCVRESAWKLVKNIMKLKENKTAYFSLSENWCLPAPSTLKPEEREFVVDSGASMHMISKKDLNSTELETVTTSRSPTTVITANGEFQTHEEATVYVKELDVFLTILEDTPAVLSLISLKNGIRIQCNTENFVPIVVPGLSASSSSSSPSSTTMTPSGQESDHPTSSSSSSTSPTTTVSSDSETRTREDLSRTDFHPARVSSSHVERTERGDPLYSDIPEWLQEIMENLVDDEVPVQRDSHASSSHESSSEPTPARSADLGKHSVYTHFPKDRNCEICQRTKITRAPCRRRIGGVVLRAGIFGDLITADHKVLSEGCESRNNHRYAVVLQHLATQWIQSYPSKTKTSQET